MSRIGLKVICETCGENSRITAETKLPSGIKVLDLDCGHLNTDDEMQFTLDTERRAGYLYANLKARTITPSIAFQIHRALERTIKTAATGRVMLVTQLGSVLDENEIFEAMGDFMTLMPGYRVAFVNGNMDQRSAMDLAALIGIQAGQNYKSFDSHIDAEEWLHGWE